MEDNTIYNFFKTRKHQFDETPGDAVWAKIEADLDKIAQQPRKRFSFKNLIFLATAIVTIGIGGIILSGRDKNATYPPLQHHNEQHYAKPSTHKSHIPENTVIKPEANPAAVSEKAVSEMLQDTVKKKKPYIAFGKITGPITNTSRDTIPFDVSNVNTTVSGTNGRVVVETKDILTGPQFKELIDKVLKENTPAAGTLVTIKAPGHKVFRQVVKTKENAYRALGSGSKDVIKKEQKESINGFVQHKEIIIVRDSIKLIGDTLKPAYLEFMPLGNKKD